LVISNREQRAKSKGPKSRAKSKGQRAKGPRAKCRLEGNGGRPTLNAVTGIGLGSRIVAGLHIRNLMHMLGFEVTACQLAKGKGKGERGRNFGLRIADWGLGIADCGLLIGDSVLDWGWEWRIGLGM